MEARDLKPRHEKYIQGQQLQKTTDVFKRLKADKNIQEYYHKRNLNALVVKNRVNRRITTTPSKVS